MEKRKRMVHPFYYLLYKIRLDNHIVNEKDLALFLLERIAEISTGSNKFDLKDYIGYDEPVKRILELIKKSKSTDWGEWYLELLNFLDTATKAEVIAGSFSYHSVKMSKEMAEDFAKRLEKEREAEEKREYNR